MSNYHSNDFYNSPTRQVSPPTLPQHQQHLVEDSHKYSMENVPVDSPSPYPVYHQHNNISDDGLGPRGAMHSPHHSISDMKFMDHYDSDDDDMEKTMIPRERRKRSCMDKFCCGCCTCCPKWARWCTCIFFIILLIIAIIIGVFVGLFKVPQVSFTGLQQEPVFAFANNVLNMQFSFGITVNNPNFESITFDTIKADAYYPSPYNVFIGGGNVTDTHISSNAVTNITFPFSVNINSTDPKEQGVLMDLVTRCGLDGSTPRNIDINYYVYPTVKIAGIPITPKIGKTMSLACPTSQLSSILGGLFQGKS